MYLFQIQMRYCVFGVSLPVLLPHRIAAQRCGDIKTNLLFCAGHFTFAQRLCALLLYRAQLSAIE